MTLKIYHELNTIIPEIRKDQQEKICELQRLIGDETEKEKDNHEKETIIKELQEEISELETKICAQSEMENGKQLHEKISKLEREVGDKNLEIYGQKHIINTFEANKQKR